MTSLTAYGRDVQSLFDLLGPNEDGMTYSLAWAMQNSERFLQRMLSKFQIGGHTELCKISLQKSRSMGSRTDIEVEFPGNGAVVVEAKKGFALPDYEQLEKYVKAYRAEEGEDLKRIVVLTACPPAVAYQTSTSSKVIEGVKVRYISWRDVVDLAVRTQAEATGPLRTLLSNFVSYLKKAAGMTDVQSNLVYVVPINREKFDGGEMRFIDVVKKRNQYFHPVGKRYPKEPPNYIAFRYDGKVQSIHHIKEVRVITSFMKLFPGTKSPRIEPHFLYDLGPAIVPTHTVRSGPVRAMRCYCMLDTLLTNASLQDALKETKVRLGEDCD